MRLRLSLFFALLCLGAALGQLAAQPLAGSLGAIVTDKTGAVVPNAKVTLTNDLSGDIRRTQTNSEGYFSIQGVLPGSYTVTIEAEGFSTYKVEKVTFNPGDRRNLPDVVLQVATTGTEVQVVSAMEQLTPVDSGEKAVVINQQQLQNVAVVGRSAAEFIKILPGMSAISPGVENRPGFNGENIGINGNGDGGKQSALGNFSANGTRSSALDITADGAHVSDPGCNCATPVNPNADMISEFKVQQSNFSAENSKGPVVMSSITKAGGRDFHGGAYLYARHYAMNANDAINNANGAPRPENKYFFPGGNIGGPVLIPGTNFNKNRDKMFFFTGFEYYKQTIDTGLLRSVVPTDAMRGGDFSDTAYMSALGKATGAASTSINTMFPDGKIPASQIDPGMQKLLALAPRPNTDPAGIGNGFNWVKVLTVDQNMWQSLSRVDYSISDNTKLFVRYNRQNELQPFPIQLWWRNAGAVPMPTPIEGKNRTDSISTSLTHVFSPSLTNEFVFGYTFVDFPNSYQDYSAMTKSTVGYPYKGIFKQDDKIPGFLSWDGPVAGMWLAGGFDPVLFATKHLVTISDNLSKVMGTHTMKFGGYYGYIINKQPGNEPSAGLATFSTGAKNTSGNVLADMVRGSINDYTENTLAVNRNMGWKEFSLFAQDSWKVNRRLTLEYGLRAQHMQPWTARNEFGTATWVPSQYSATGVSSDLPGISWHSRDNSIPLSGWDTKAIWWAPRVGFALDIFGTGRTVFRGGYGKFVYHDAQLAAGAMDLPAGLRNTNQCCGLNLRDMDLLNTQGNLVTGGELVDSTDSRQPVTQNWSATISQRLPGRSLMEVAYVGSKSDNLINVGTLRDINLVPLGAMLNDPTGDTNAHRPLNQYQALNVNSHGSYSNYHSLQTTFAKQTGIVNYTVAYTWSKAMGIMDNANNIVDSLNIGNNYAPLSFDRTHVFSASYVINVPDLVKGGGNRLGRAVANGWQISGIMQLSSGVNLQANTGNGNFNMRAYRSADPADNTTIGGPYVLGTNAVQMMPKLTCNPVSGLGSDQYINGSCFAPPTIGANGQFGQNGDLIFPLLRGPAFFNTDLSLFKNFRISEAKSVQFRFSAYNAPNHPVASFVNSDQNLRMEFDHQGQLVNPRFGYADTKVGRRIIQLGLKFFF